MNRAEKRRQRKKTQKPGKKPNRTAADSPSLRDPMVANAATIELAIAYHDAGDLSTAEAIYRQILQENPNHPIALHLLGLVAHQVAKNDLAAELIEAAIANEPDYPVAHYNLGIVRKALGRDAEAAASYLNALTLKPDYADAHNNYGLELHAMRRLEDAEAVFRKAIILKPDYAEAHNNLGLLLQELGRLDDAATNYHQAIAVRPDFAEAFCNLGSVFHEIGQLDSAAEAFQQAISINQDLAVAHSGLGYALHAQQKFDEAVVSCQKALALRPDYAQAHNNLGIAQQDLGRLDDARASFNKALASAPNYGKAHYNLGNVLQHLGELDAAVSSYNRALEITPRLYPALNNLGNALKNLGDPHRALVQFQMALDIEPGSDEARHGLGLAQMLTGDLENGWGNYNYRWRIGVLADYFRGYEKALWNGQEVAGHRLLIWEEQGIGDSIMYAGAIADLVADGAEVLLECDARLVPLYQRSFPEITCAAMNKSLGAPPAFKDFDLHAPFGSLGRWRRPNFASFPKRPSYLVADDDLRQKLRRRYLARGNDILVGIAWYSGSQNYGKQKSLTLDNLRPLLEIPGITFVDLQYGDTMEERTSFTADTGLAILHDEEVDQMADLELFAAQVAAMDTVVTISNTTAHMAGGLGVPTLLMLGVVPIWYWFLERRESPWYPSLRLFRQQEFDDWHQVVKQVKDTVIEQFPDIALK